MNLHTGLEGSTLQQTILQGVWQQARQQPNRIALRMGSICYTYQQLIACIEQIALGVSARGLWQKRIGLYLANHPDYLIAFYGCVRAGAIAVPLPVDLPPEQIDEYKEHLELTEVWDQESVSKLIQRERVATKPSPHPGTTSSTLPETDSNDLPARKLPAIGSDDLFYMAVSSGSTGKPKGILRNHHSWVTSFDAMKQAFDIGKKDTILIPGPLHYSASLIAALQVLDQGGEVDLLPAFREEVVLDHLRTGKITAIFMVPAMIAKLMSKLAGQPETNEPALNPLHELSLTVVSAGAKLDLTWKKAWMSYFKQSRLFEYYGAAELSFVSYVRPWEQLTVGNSVGKPFPQVRLIIRDESGSECGIGQIGQVYVQSEMVAQAYGHRGAGEFLVPLDGCYSVGDMGYLDEAGYLVLTGRKQEMILRGGVNVYPLEIEQVLHQHPDVSEVAVLGIPDMVMGERIVAVIVLSAQDEEPSGCDKWLTRDVSIFHPWITSRLSHSRWPDYYLIVKQLPLGTTGKNDKQALRNRLAALAPEEGEKNNGSMD